MKKFFALLLALSMVLSLVACGSTKKAEETPAPVEETPAAEPVEETPAAETVAVPGPDATDEEIYDYILGDYYEAYTKALECMDISERYALEAIAEAKLLQASVLQPSTARGGAYRIGRTVPRSASTVLWGNDEDRQHYLMVTTEPITTEDYYAIKALWNEAPDAETYVANTKAYLADKGYELKDEYQYPQSADPQTWDVLGTYLQADAEALVQTYEGLMEYDQKNVLQPALAES